MIRGYCLSVPDNDLIITRGARVFFGHMYPVQSSNPLEGGKKIPLLVEFLILNASEVMPPGFNSDNMFSILNPVDHNANHLCSPVPTCSDDEGSQRTPIIEEVDGDASPSLSDLREDLPSEIPSRFLEVIHENDGQEQVQQRSNELFKHDVRHETKPDRLKEEKTFLEEPPSRKESREEATQTPDCGLPRIGDAASRFPAFRGSTAHLSETVTPSSDAPLARKEADLPTTPTVRPIKDGSRGDEPQKPTVHVHPFTPDLPSQEPILRTITERLQSLRDNQLNVDSSPRLLRRSMIIADEPVRLRNSYIEASESPRFSRKTYEPEASPMVTRRSMVVESRVPHDDLYSPLYKPQEFPYRSDPYKNFDSQLITERFSSYCIEPPTEEQLRKEPSSTKRVDQHQLVRSESQRSEKPSNNLLRERAASVKSGRRGDPCVGMDSLEINWSVRQLKTLFQDKRAPAINTDYTIN
ncbi:unnamed protein product [Heligmosomoides polygyrus]|uniref:Rho-GAP domain-containing protein n=1 Tax=Heligmosomoides polygyrus TaxID=6339 RepID=A0A183GJB9_HELPZ|nr:unnamed protein product [Heligmosomoides polygyrus]